MLSLRERLNAYHSQERQAEKQPAAPTACYRTANRTERAAYGLPDHLDTALLHSMSGLQLDGDLPLEGLLFLDTETTGLSGGAGTIAFLTGLGWFEGDTFVVEQDLMRDYPEEPAMLERVVALIERSQLLVTFNGRTFDVPLLESRLTMNGKRVRLTERPHLDLLHPARAVFKLRLQRCRLACLEETVLDIHREDDLPGSEVPKVWFQYLKDGDFRPVERILEHNLQDIRSMPLLLSRMLSLYEAPLSIPWQEDIYSIGRVLEKRGQMERARKCYHAADGGRLSRLARLSLAENYRKSTDYGHAAEVYERMLRDGQGSVQTMVRLAILYEHRLGRPQDALALTRRAMLLTEDPDELAALNRRYQRLNRKG